jgi:hypothetical protein
MGLYDFMWGKIQGWEIFAKVQRSEVQDTKYAIPSSKTSKKSLIKYERDLNQYDMGRTKLLFGGVLQEYLYLNTVWN